MDFGSRTVDISSGSGILTRTGLDFTPFSGKGHLAFASASSSIPQLGLQSVRDSILPIRLLPNRIFHVSMNPKKKNKLLTKIAQKPILASLRSLSRIILQGHLKLSARPISQRES